jgi:hypothetical protein
VPDPLLRQKSSFADGPDFQAEYAAAERAAEFYAAKVRRQGNYVFFELTPRVSQQFVARLECDDYPAQAPDLVFVDPKTNAISNDRRHWPPESRVLQDPDGLHLCLPGTRWFEKTHRQRGTREDRGLARILEVLAICCNGQAQALDPRMRRKR